MGLWLKIHSFLCKESLYFINWPSKPPWMEKKALLGDLTVAFSYARENKYFESNFFLEIRQE